MLNSWYQDGLVTTKALNGDTYTSNLFVATTGTKSYMSIGSSAGASHQTPSGGAFEVGIAPIPQVDVQNPKAISQGPSVCIFQNVAGKTDISDQEIVASWLFVKFLTTSVEFQAEFSMASGYMPVLKSVESNPVYAAFLAKADGYNFLAATSAKVAMDQKDAYYTSPAFNGSSKARDEVGALLQAAMVLTRDGSLDAKIKELFQIAIEECEYSI
jgi:multiple sugar transport system substrate-binding protein